MDGSSMVYQQYFFGSNNARLEAARGATDTATYRECLESEDSRFTLFETLLKRKDVKYSVAVRMDI